MVDFGRSRRRGWIRDGRVRPGIAPRGPWVIREPFLEVGTLGENLPEYHPVKAEAC